MSIPAQNPWEYPAPPTWPVNKLQAVAADDRMRMVKNTDDPSILQDMIDWPGTQISVRKKAQARLNKMRNKEDHR